MIYFAWFFMATVFVVIGSRLYYGKSINPKEVLAHFGAGVVAALLGTMITVLSMWSGTLETNLLHGKITGKEKQYSTSTNVESLAPVTAREIGLVHPSTVMSILMTGIG